MKYPKKDKNHNQLVVWLIIGYMTITLLAALYFDKLINLLNPIR